MMWWTREACSAGEWFAMSFMMLVFWGPVIALIVWVVWVVCSTRAGHAKTIKQGEQSLTPHADEVLAERFARGEIDAEEFSRRGALLHGSASRGTEVTDERPEISSASRVIAGRKSLALSSRED